MSDSQSIIEITKFIRQFPKWDDEFDKFIEPYKDYTDTFSDLAVPIKAFFSVRTLAKKIKYKQFLKGYANAINTQQFDDKLESKFRVYLENPENLEYVAQLIDSALDAKSSKCSLILGYYAGLVLTNLKPIEYKDMLIIDGLKIMVDSDIENFIILFDLYSDKAVEKYLRTWDIKEDFILYNKPIFEIENTIEKLKGALILGYDVGGNNNVGNAWGSFQFNENTLYFNELIRKTITINL